MFDPSPMRAGAFNRSHGVKAESEPPVTKIKAPKLAEVSSTTPRRLIRPTLPARPFSSRGLGSSGTAPLTARKFKAGAEDARPPEQASHAETFYLQKQAHSKTLMVFVLDDGERIEGYIDWYDRQAVKVRYGMARTLIYKRCIKYLYKAGDGVQI
jgi:sRNA-binding regulator protein Hfq